MTSTVQSEVLHRRDDGPGGRGWVTPASICLLALGLRLAYLALTGSHPLTSDASQYETLATNLAAGRGFAEPFPQLFVHPTAFRLPLYPAFLSAVFTVFGPGAGLARAVNVVLGVGVVALTFVVVERHVSRRAAVGAALAVAVSSNLIANDTFALDEPLALLLVLVLVHALASRRFVSSGVATGLLVLTRPSAEALAVVVALWVLVSSPTRPTGRLRLPTAEGWRRVGVFAASLLVVVTPWLLRNWIQLGAPVLTTSTGFNWSAVYSAPAERRENFVDPVFDPAFSAERIDQFDEVTWNSALQRLGTQNLEHHPAYALDVVARNAAAFFELQPWRNDAAEREDGRDLSWVADTTWLFYVELAMGAVGLWWERRRVVVRALVVQAAAFTVASLAFVAAPRLRAPLDLALAVGVGLFVHHVSGRSRPEPVDVDGPTIDVDGAPVDRHDLDGPRVLVTT